MSIGHNRAERTAAKEVPHRKQGRVYSARTDVRHSCEEILAKLKHAPLHEAARRDMEAAVARVQARVGQISDSTSGARGLLEQAGKEAAHLASAESWLAQAQRVEDRLSPAAQEVRGRLEEAAEMVLGLVRRDILDGTLTAAVAALKDLVSDAEARASRAG